MKTTKIRKKWHDIIRSRLKRYRKECLACLYPPNSWHWGCGSKKYKNKTLELINKIVKNVPTEAFPPQNRDLFLPYKIASNNWRIALAWDYDGWRYRRVVDLKFKHDDHTAWVREHRDKKGIFINFDIGGS